MKVPGKVTSPGSRPGKDARQPVGFRPLSIVLALFVFAYGVVFGALFLASAMTKNDVRRLVQEQCGLSSTSFAGEVSIDGDAKVPYVDSTGANAAIVHLVTAQAVFNRSSLPVTCGPCPAPPAYLTTRR